QDENKVVSERDVRIANIAEKNIVTGEYAEYWRKTRYGKIVGHPVLVKLDSLDREFMHVAGDTMELHEDLGQTHVRGSVVIKQEKTVATSREATYFKKEERTLLTGEPKVVQRNREITGDTLSIFMKDNQLSRALVKGSAMVASDADTLNKGRWVNKLTGYEMDFLFREGQLQRVVIEHQATSVYHVIEDNQYKGANEVSGDKIKVTFLAGVLQRVEVTSKPEFSSGKYSPPKI
ncbi:MAG: LptA/OstA family protein, partial [bacterium]